MLNLYTSVIAKVAPEESFAEGEKLSVLYHNLFDFPLSFADLIRWKACDERIDNSQLTINQKSGYFFLEGREGLIYQKLLRKRISAKKLEIGKRASRILSFIPTVRMVAVTGSLAMGNSTDESDIDLMIITSKNTLWLSRLLVYFVLRAANYKLRRPFDKAQKDKLCLNMWLDENDLIFRDRNLYTAHEIAQVFPLVNKNKTYEKFLYKNKWILNFWPNAVKIVNCKLKIENSSRGMNIFELIAYKLQHLYMKSKITREVITPTRALFHPQDWGKVVLSRFTS